MKEKIRGIVKDSVEELNEQLDDDKVIEFSEDVRLIGKKSVLDSMDFVTLITIIEERISDQLDLDIRIVSDKAFSMERSPFYSLGTLIDFVTEIVEEQAQ